jgi:hypothetical protein
LARSLQRIDADAGQWMLDYYLTVHVLTVHHTTIRPTCPPEGAFTGFADYHPAIHDRLEAIRMMRNNLVFAAAAQRVIDRQLYIV